MTSSQTPSTPPTNKSNLTDILPHENQPSGITTTRHTVIGRFGITMTIGPTKVTLHSFNEKLIDLLEELCKQKDLYNVLLNLSCYDCDDLLYLMQPEDY